MKALPHLEPSAPGSPRASFIPSGPLPRLLEHQPQFSPLWLFPYPLSSPVCAPWWAGISDIPSPPKVLGTLTTPRFLSLGNTSNLGVQAPWGSTQPAHT